MPATTAGYSSTVKPTTFTILRVSGRCVASHGSCSRRTTSSPGFASPTALIIPPVELGDARRRRAVPRLERHGLGDEAAEPLGPHDAGELLAVPGRAGGEDDRILKYEIANDRPERARRVVTATRPCPRRS